MLRERDFGIDLSSQMIAVAKQRYADDRGIEVSRGDAEFLPFAELFGVAWSALATGVECV